MQNANNLTQEFVRKLFVYEPETGLLKWRIKYSRKIIVGKIAGWIPDSGGNYYAQVRIDGVLYQQHQVIWIYMEGSIPDGFEVDHINRIY